MYKKVNKKAIWLSAIVMFASTTVLYVSCTKSKIVQPSATEETTETYDKLSYESLFATDTSFIYLDSTDSVRTFNIYDGCAALVGTISTNTSTKSIEFSSQTSSTVTIVGQTSITLNKGVAYWFKPNNCSSGSYILKVTFATGIQPFCKRFKLTNCTWSNNGSCSIISSYSFVTKLAIPC
ncbi:MAG TPA: hypothetical protein PKN75_14535 [Bacteroidia bacterium]|nr:hypothetical protein [Bacteroidia bacterium]HNU34802.1 hypothetical protein [Bacteroidia bacterium]